jgi:hypothetical protein
LQHRELLQEQAEAMNASMKVLTPEQKWHAGRQADAFFGLLDQHQELTAKYNAACVEIESLRKALKRLEPKIKKQCAP